VTATASTLTFEVPLDNDDFSGDYPALAIPQAARHDAKEALQQGETHYVAVPGIEPLRVAVAEWVSRFGLEVSKAQVVVTAGEQEARFLTLQSLLQKGYRAAVPAVVAPGVRAALAMRPDAAASIPSTRAGLLPSVEAIGQALAGGCNLLYLESPSRLTGFAYTVEEVEQIATLLEAHDALCIWDQSTAPAMEEPYPSLAAIAPNRTLAIGFLWPGMGLAAWQLGYIVAPPPLIGGLTSLKQMMAICTSTAAQWAAVGAAKRFAQDHAALREEMEAVRHEILSTLTGDERVLAGEAVNVLALNVGEGAGAILDRLAEESMEVADGAAFGAPGVLRVTMKPDSKTGSIIYRLLEGV
jgi:arginine:pyruvate transaminase